MRTKILLIGLVLGLSARAALAQTAPHAPFPGNIYCAGIVTTENVSHDTYVISGEQSEYRATFDQGDIIYINKGSKQGVKVGDVFSVIRPETDTVHEDWSRWQYYMLGKMGTVWQDQARVTVVSVRPDLSIARIDHACDFVQRGDIVLPFVERPQPPLKPETNFDPFALPTGKTLAMIITGPRFQQVFGNNDIVYVNLGSKQGVNVGDYFRIFRYTDDQHEKAYQTPRYAFDVEGPWGPTVGLGSSPSKWNWTNTPRQNIGEGVVLRTGPDSSVVLITYSLREIFAGYYVEAE
jgi:Flagellar assembly protein T, C-terminal domain